MADFTDTDGTVYRSGGAEYFRPLMVHDDFESAINRIFAERVVNSDYFCTELWGALTNTYWSKPDCKTVLYSFRAAGDLIAAIREEGNYMDWYSTGSPGVVTDEIRADLLKEGWTPKC